MFTRFKLVLLIVTLLLPIWSVHATSFIPECAEASYREGQADLVAVAERTQDVEVVEDDATVSTLVFLDVLEVSKGTSTAEIVLEQPGGVLPDGTSQQIPSLTLEWPLDTTWRLSLVQGDDETYSLVCGEFGRETLNGEMTPTTPFSGVSNKILEQTYGGLLNNDQLAEVADILWFIIIASIWSLIWKGIALWHAARAHQKAWFIVLLIMNTLGILEIIYLLFWRKRKDK